MWASSSVSLMAMFTKWLSVRWKLFVDDILWNHGLLILPWRMIMYLQIESWSTDIASEIDHVLETTALRV